MPHSTTIKPTEQHPTCANCDFFTGFNGEERGACQVFEKVFKSPNPRTSDCDRSIESLLQQPKTYSVMVELFTKAVENDGSGHAVPIGSRTVEVNVAQPIRALVERAIALRKDLEGYTIAQYWIPDGGYEI